MPPLNALKAFEAAARHLNFRLAAEELSVTQGAVAQHVRGLEQRFRLKLFDRLPRGLALTDEGRRYLPPVRRAFDMIADATENLAPGATLITISTTPSFAARWLVHRLGDFAAAHPDIRVRLDASNALVNFQTDGVDIAIRQGQPPFGPGLTADLLFASELVTVCRPDLLRGSGAIRTAADLAKHTLLQDSHGYWPLFLEAVGLDSADTGTRMMNFSQTSMAIDAALAGQGIALASRAFVEVDLGTGRLCQPLPVTVPMQESHYIVAPRAPRHPQTVRQIHDWLLAQQ